MRLRVVSRLRLAMFLMLLSMLLVLGGWIAGARASSSCADSAGQGEQTMATSILVAPGDSLWSIAGVYAPDNMDPRVAVFELRHHNSLDSASLSVGQLIGIPLAWTR